MPGRLAAFSFLALLAPGAVTTSWVSKSVNKADWYKLTVSYPQFSGTPLSKIANKDISTAALAEMNDVKKSAGTSKPRVPSELIWKATVGTTSPTMISLYANIYEFEGGAHGQSVLSAFNYKMVGGKPQKIGLANIMLVRITPEALATQILIPKIKKLPNASLVTDGSIKTITKDQADNFVVTTSGITWLFSQGDLGAEAEGTAMVKVPWSELKGKVSLGP